MARKATTRSRKDSGRSYDDVPDTGDVVTVDEELDDGFDADLDVDEESKPTRKRASGRKSDDDEPSAKSTKTKRKKATKKKATRRKKAAAPDEVPDEPVEDSLPEEPGTNGEADSTDSKSKSKAKSKASRSKAVDADDEPDDEPRGIDWDDDGSDEPAVATSDGDSDDSAGDEETAPRSSGGDNGNGRGRAPSSSGDDGGNDGAGGRRRRRRRRRRRGGRGGDGDQQPPQQQPQANRQGRRRAEEEITGTYEGVLELHPKNYGFLRDRAKDYHSQDNDPFVSSSLIEKYGLREGVMIKGDVGPGSRNQGPRLKSVETIDGRTPEEYAEIRDFDELTPINPFEKIKLERGPAPITMRVLDLLTPIGKGQRALIVAPPRSGKTMLMQDIAESVSQNHPEIHLMVLLIDERPEEVTEMRRNVNGEVIASSMDKDVESHVRVSQLLVERAKRMAEAGEHVLILLDSITRLGRAFNKWVGNSGRTGTGGLDVRALDIPRKMFGTARRFDEGGSLTVVGTALVETGSRADDAIFQEFKGTGNMELVLNRDLADRRIFPAMDIEKSGTRREEKLFDPESLEGVTMLRRSLVSLSSVEAMEQLIRTLQKFPTNAEFLQRVRSVL